ncbi:Phosphoglycolate phosphatase [subsurface metagenome]
MGIVSNTISSRYAPDLMKRLGIHGLFDIIVLSAGFGHRKPHPSIFLEAVRNMPLAPARCAYVGDNPSRDVAGPRKVGFGMTVLIRNPERVLPEPLDGGEHPDEFIDELSDLLKLFVGVKA